MFLTFQYYCSSLTSYKGLGIDDNDFDVDNGIFPDPPRQLQHLEFKYVNSFDCQEAMDSDSPTVTETMMCAQGPGEDLYSGVCYGDSGGKYFSFFTTTQYSRSYAYTCFDICTNYFSKWNEFAFHQVHFMTKQIMY